VSEGATMTRAKVDAQRDWNPSRFRLEEARRKRVLCAGFDLDDYPCGWRAVMLWYGIPFCPQHTPVQRPGHGGWTRL
jgi:hypothetical protein